ncbi:thiol reductant ABC exporter subunit CydC, partial [Paracraurococcus ruber]
MLTDLARVLGLWRAQAPWLLLGVAVSVLSALLGVALLSLAGQGIAAALGGAALGGGLVFLLLRPLVLLRPAARWWERMATHAATFRALADTRIWFFRRLAERLPSGIGLGRSGDLLGRLVSDVDALDGLYLRAMVPVLSALAIVLAGGALLAGAPLLAALVALPLGIALLLPLVLAPGAARAAAG